ncbi:MAG: FkbM family methyltransferase [Deltaproteobacteria bacterium]|nr:FkbM family methyltransferase [Deltaproteobacteria bacterium]
MSSLLHKTAKTLIRTATRYEHYHWALMERLRERLYTSFAENHVFDIKSDDMAFKMTFKDYPLGRTIVERIEARREPETVASIKALVRKGDRVLELGGAYGYFTTIMALCTGETGKVVSIECTPNNFEILKSNMELNNLKHVSLHNVFLTDDDGGTVEFTPSDTDFYGATDRVEKGERAVDSSAKLVQVPTVRLSNLLKEISYKPQRIFMDIEGFEVCVLEDLSRSGVLKECRPSILFETHEMFYKPGKGLDYIRDILTSNGYYCRELSGNWMCHHEQDPIA